MLHARSAPDTRETFKARPGDYYWLHVDAAGEEWHVGQDERPGLMRGEARLEVFVTGVDRRRITEHAYTFGFDTLGYGNWSFPPPAGRGWSLVRNLIPNPKGSRTGMSAQWARVRTWKILVASREAI